MGKRDLSEEDIKARYITPAVEGLVGIRNRYVMNMRSQQGELFFVEM